MWNIIRLNVIKNNDRCVINIRSVNIRLQNSTNEMWRNNKNNKNILAGIRQNIYCKVQSETDLIIDNLYEYL